VTVFSAESIHVDTSALHVADLTTCYKLGNSSHGRYYNVASSTDTCVPTIAALKQM
jgi:hypothetical protein